MTIKSVRNTYVLPDIKMAVKLEVINSKSEKGAICIFVTLHNFSVSSHSNSLTSYESCHRDRGVTNVL